MHRLVQGIEFYKNVKTSEEVPGLMHAYFGDYHIRDIEFVAAFDVNRHKIGKDLSEAIYTGPNSCAKFADVPLTGVKVQAGPVMDGVAPHMVDSFYVAEDHQSVDVVEILRERARIRFRISKIVFW